MIGAILTLGLGSFGSVNLLPTLGYGTNAPPPAPPTPGRQGLGGDDVPYSRSPHRGWDRKEWLRLRKRPDDELEATLRDAYAALTSEDAPLSVLARVDEITRPVAKVDERVDIPLQINWKALSASYERASALYRLWSEEQELRAAMEDEDDVLFLINL